MLYGVWLHYDFTWVTKCLRWGFALVRGKTLLSCQRDRSPPALSLSCQHANPRNRFPGHRSRRRGVPPRCGDGAVASARRASQGRGERGSLRPGDDWVSVPSPLDCSFRRRRLEGMVSIAVLVYCCFYVGAGKFRPHLSCNSGMWLYEAVVVV